MNIDFPFHLNQRGGTATADDARHVRNMIEQVLFTAPGERVNRPDFGSGLLHMVFGPNSQEVAAALQVSMQASLQRWLGDLIELRTLDVTASDSTLHVQLAYVVSRTGEQRRELFERSLA